MFLCETYHCRMAEAACVVRQRNAAGKKWNAGAGVGDPGCIDCEQGKAITGSMSAEDANHYSKILVGVRNRALARKKTGRKSGSVDMPKDNNTVADKKICTDPDCVHKGKSLPIKKFQRARFGHMNICVDCLRRRQKDGFVKKKKAKAAAPRIDPQKEKQAREAEERLGLRAPPAETTTPAPSNHQSITIDFTGHTDLLDGLRRIADNEMRSMTNQILFMIKEQISSTAGERKGGLA